MSNFINRIFDESTERRHTRFWLFSDLQQRNPVLAEKYFTIAMEDFKSIGTDITGICYLGDASEGTDLKLLDTMISMQLKKLDEIGAPIYYVVGNHELEYYRHCLKTKEAKPIVPFFDAVHGRPNWHLVQSQEDFWFAEEMSEFTMLFFSDHASKDGLWFGFHENMPDPPDHYPYPKEAWLAVRDKFAGTKPVFTFAHCGFPGANRPAALLAQMLPLPDNFRAHFYGHAHIGDEVWAGCNLYRQIACVENQPILQFDIASLDHLRGSTVRSAFFDYYGDGEYGVFFRDHVNARWEHFFISTHDAKSAGLPEKTFLGYPA